MNRRNLLRSAFGCAVATPLAARTAVVMVPKKFTMTADWSTSPSYGTIYFFNVKTGEYWHK